MLKFTLIIAIFFISPISSVLIASIYSLTQSKSINNFKVLVFVLSLFVSLLNTLKVPESDLLTYIDIYNDSKYFSLSEFLLAAGKEPLFYLFSYLVHFLSNGNDQLYIFIISFISYFLLGYSMLLIHEVTNFDKVLLITGLFALFLFPNLFSLSAHLLRQFLAASVVILAIVRKGFYSKNIWSLLIIASLIHTTALFFIFILLPFLHRPINIKNLFITLFIVSLSISLVFLLTEFLNKFLINIPFVNYVFIRLSNQGQGVELDSIGFLSIVLFILTLLFLWISFIWSLELKGVTLLFNISFILVTFVLINYNNTELALRLSFYVYFIFPFSLYLFFGYVARFFGSSLVFLCILVNLFMISWFSIKLINGTWDYIDLQNLFIYL